MATAVVRSGRRRSPAVVVVVMLLSVALVAPLSSPPSAAVAAEYPSWSEVEQARQDEAAKQVQIEQIAALIGDLDRQVAEGQRIQERRAAAYEKAQASLDDATFAADKLQAEADEATADADGAKQQAGRIAHP